MFEVVPTTPICMCSKADMGWARRYQGTAGIRQGREEMYLQLRIASRLQWRTAQSGIWNFQKAEVQSA